MTSSSRMILGTRGSALALAQTTLVRAMLHRAFPKLVIEVKIIKTSGDKQKRLPLARSGVKGLFTKELEEALLRGKIDAAIHSLKDMPTEMPAGLAIAAVPKREDPSDVLIAKVSDAEAPPRVVYTSSPRRAFQAKILWPRAELKEIRGNVETRLLKLAETGPGEFLILASAGLRRLEFLRGADVQGNLQFDPVLLYRTLALTEMIPAPGQGAIAIQTRSADGEIFEKFRSVNHSASMGAVTAERAFLYGIGGGCATPAAAHAKIEGKELTLTAAVAREDGSIWRGDRTGGSGEAEQVGFELARSFKNSGIGIMASQGKVE